MANFSLDEWGTPVIGGAISVWGDMGANSILGGKTVLFNLNPRKVLSEVVYGSHPTLVVSAIRYMGEVAEFADVRRIEIAASAIEVISLTEASIQAAVRKIRVEIASLGESIHKDVHVSIPVHVTTVGDTYVRGILTGAEEICMIADSRMILDIQVIKSEVAGIGDVFASATTRVFNEGLRIRDVINNSFIPILSGIDEWGNPVIGIMTPLGDVIHANISGGKDFVIRKTSWMELTEIVSLLQTHTSRVTKVFSEIAIAVDVRVSEVAKVPFDEVMYVVDTYIPVVEAVRAEVVSVIEGAGQTIVERYLAEVPVMVDVVNRRFPRYVSEVFVVIDTRRLYPKKYVKEVVEVLDSKVYTATHFMYEVIQATEDKKVTFYLADVVGLADAYIISMRRVFSEVTAYVDSYYRTQFLYEIVSAKEDMYTMFWKYMMESISIADYYRNLFVKIEAIKVADSYLKAATHYIYDAFTPHDRTVRRNPLHYISDRVCATDISIKYYITRPLVELIAGVDTVLRRVSKTRTEKTTLHDTRGRTTITKYLSDIISATDNLIGRSFAILTEKIYAADTYSRNTLTTIKEKLKFKDSKLSHPYAYALETLQLIETKISHPMVSLLEALTHIDTAIRKPTHYLLDSTLVIDRKYKHAQAHVINIIAFIDEKYTSYTKV
ncbi:MAG TPA: hypothetical protein PL124_11960, partial [Candidatus Cloacimonadota bacterium]|nr:hypothetical protein [Candidatus Cloacimonadota bacterium]